LVVEEQAFLSQFATAELDGFHLIFASPSEANRLLSVRHVDLLVLDASIPAEQKSEVLACAGEANVPSVVLTRQPDFPDDHSAASMPVSASDLAVLLGKILPQGD
jgi:hypothetical protein